MTENMSEEAPPYRPVNGRVMVRELPYRPSKILEVVSTDRADFTEGIVVALSEGKYARRKTRKGWEMTGTILPHDVALGDRVILRGSYQDDDLLTINGVKHRIMDPWEIEAIIEKPQPTGYEDPQSGEMLPDKHPLLTP